MRFLMVCKRHYTNRDLLSDRYGRLYHLPAQLAEGGHDVLVLAADYQNSHPERLTAERLTFESIPLSVSRLPTFARSIWRAAKHFQPDLVIASADTPFGIAGSVIARRLSVPFVFDLYDDYRVFASARLPGMRYAFERVLRSADLVVCAGGPLQDIARKHNPSTLVVQNGVDRDLFRPLKQATARSELGLSDDAQIVGFFGSIADRRGVDVLINAIARLRKMGRPLTLLVAGSLDVPLDLAASWIDYRGLVQQEEVPALICACDVVVIPYLNDPQVDASSASKLPEYLACSVAIVTTQVSDYVELFGIPEAATCLPGDVEDLKRALAFQLDSPARVPLPDGFDWESLGFHLESALNELL